MIHDTMADDTMLSVIQLLFILAFVVQDDPAICDMKVRGSHFLPKIVLYSLGRKIFGTT